MLNRLAQEPSPYLLQHANLYRGDTNTYVAWIFNNDRNERVAVLDDRIATLAEIKAELEFHPDFGPAEGATAATTTWEISAGNPLRCEGIEVHPG